MLEAYRYRYAPRFYLLSLYYKKGITSDGRECPRRENYKRFREVHLCLIRIVTCSKDGTSHSHIGGSLLNCDFIVTRHAHAQPEIIGAHIQGFGDPRQSVSPGAPMVMTPRSLRFSHSLVIC
jgi:hypothetical protein